MVKILIIDNDKDLNYTLQKWLEEKEYNVYTAFSGKEGLKVAKKIIPHIVFLDMKIDDISGIDVIKKVKKYEKTIRVIVLHSNIEKDFVKSLSSLGVTDFVKKPFSINYLENTVMSKIYSKTIEHQKETMIQIIYALADTLDAKDPYTRGHSESVVKYVHLIANELQYVKGWRWLSNKKQFLKNIGLLHDIGKMGIKDQILNKPGKLSTKEMDEIKKHPSIGSHIVSIVDDLKELVNAVRHHHERWDGKGYPENLKEKDIPKEARLLTVADAYDAMTSNRPYRKALPVKAAIEELHKNKGTQFDPIVVEAFLQVLKKN